MMAGTYRLELKSPGYWPRAVAVEAGASDLRLWMARRSTLQVRLLTPEGEPLANERVDFLHVQLNANSQYWIASGLVEPENLTKNSEGLLSVEGLPEGSYRFTGRDGNWSGQAELSWPAGDCAEVQLAGS